MHTRSTLLELRNQSSNAPAARAFAMDPEWTRLALPASDGTVQIFNVASGESDGPPLDGGIRTGLMTSDYEPFTFTFTSNGKLLVWSVLYFDVMTRLGEVASPVATPSALYRLKKDSLRRALLSLIQQTIQIFDLPRRPCPA